MAMEVDVAETLRVLKTKASGEVQHQLSQCEELYERKLWHQLTEVVLGVVGQPSAQPLLRPLYDGFVCAWEQRMSRIALVRIALAVSAQLPDPREAVAFMDAVAEKVGADAEALVFATVEAAHHRLMAGDVAGTLAAIEKSQKLLDTLSGISSLVHAAFYRVSSDYYKAKADYNQFYKNALLFLACVNLEEMPPNQRLEKAFDLSVAAVLGDAIYNFGELLMHPILDVLKGTPNEWIGQLLLAFNAGDIGKFDIISSANFSKINVLAQNAAFLRQKLCLMALIELVFQRTGSDRRIPFDLIRQSIQLPADEVEHLIMKALSLGLIKGKIDQVDQVVAVTWVQPRVLDKTQISAVLTKVKQWEETTKQTSVFMADVAPELYVQ